MSLIVDGEVVILGEHIYDCPRHDRPRHDRPRHDRPRRSLRLLD